MHKIKALDGRSKEASRERNLSKTQPRTTNAMMTMSQRWWQYNQFGNIGGKKRARVRDLRERERERENVKSKIERVKPFFFFLNFSLTRSVSTG